MKLNLNNDKYTQEYIMNLMQSLGYDKEYTILKSRLINLFRKSEVAIKTKYNHFDFFREADIDVSNLNIVYKDYNIDISPNRECGEVCCLKISIPEDVKYYDLRAFNTFPEALKRFAEDILTYHEDFFSAFISAVSSPDILFYFNRRGDHTLRIRGDKDRFYSIYIYAEDVPKNINIWLNDFRGYVNFHFYLCGENNVTIFNTGGASSSSIIYLDRGSNVNYTHLVLHEKNGRYVDIAKLRDNSVLRYGLGVSALDNNLIDANIKVYHIGRQSHSNVNMRSLVASSSYMKGYIKIDEIASGSESHLNQLSLVLDSNAKVFNYPSMRIETNEVTATHSAATIKPDEDKMFYLRSRGFSGKEALEIYSTGFLSSILPTLPQLPYLEDEIANKVRGFL